MEQPLQVDENIIFLFLDIYTMLRWFGVPEATIINVKNPGSTVYILQKKDIDVDGEHPLEEALDSDTTLIKKNIVIMQHGKKSMPHVNEDLLMITKTNVQ